jgi:uncharacterized protein (DUF1499 family)
MSGFNQILKSSFIILSASFLIACSGTPPKDLGYLPEGDLRPCPSSPNCELVSFENPYGLQSGIDKLKASILATEGKLISQQQVSAQKTYLHSEYTSLIMRFVDDVELVVNEDKVILRSASRLGHSDFGVNAARVEDIKAAFFAEQ